MTRIVIVGEIYNADLSIGGGPVYPGAPGAPGGPVDPGWSGGVAPPPGIWGGAPGLPGHGNIIGGGPIYPGAPVDPGYSPPWARPGRGPVDPGWSGGVAPPPGIWGGAGSLPPSVTPPIYIPPQIPTQPPGDPDKGYIVAYVPGSGYVTFTVDLTSMPEPVPPAEPEPKG